ncbi:MAG: hypothetical protein V4451_21385, partial [Pseudomonadota bacterium]
ISMKKLSSKGSISSENQQTPVVSAMRGCSLRALKRDFQQLNSWIARCCRESVIRDIVARATIIRRSPNLVAREFT